ncbi:DUF4870 domain-containing protein [Moheibacter sediminis]|uniref:Uncharacterized membrane protein n=1 Tax=Moheibacter sediminis TaxID=1434700 RepID=A0A1W1Y989_9FLAO|nr:DUF4870 domain-containing protein [Moheibacter sediminis]SMC32780.1 Uncharacterized membrane protein [Moheibacter sediminis]
MDEKTKGIVSYLTWIGLIIVILTDKPRSEYVSFHIRQSLGLMLLWSFGGIFYYLPGIGKFIVGLLYLVLFVFWIIALMGALNHERKIIPVLGEKFQEWFKSI